MHMNKQNKSVKHAPAAPVANVVAGAPVSKPADAMSKPVDKLIDKPVGQAATPVAPQKVGVVPTPMTAKPESATPPMAAKGTEKSADKSAEKGTDKSADKSAPSAPKATDKIAAHK